MSNHSPDSYASIDSYARWLAAHDADIVASMKAPPLDAEKWREHSVILNRMTFDLATALGLNPENADHIHLDPLDVLAVTRKRLDEAKAQQYAVTRTAVRQAIIAADPKADGWGIADALLAPDGPLLDAADVMETTARAAAFDALQYISVVISDTKYGHDPEWLAANAKGVGRVIEQKADITSGPQASIPAWDATNPYRKETP